MKKIIFEKPVMKGKNGMIDGVCSGIANLFSVDPFWVRLAFILFGLLPDACVSMLIIYIILSFIMKDYKEENIDLNKK